MKKTKAYVLFFIIIVITIGLTSDVIIPNAYSLSYDEHILLQKDNLWQLGKNLSVGDSYTYKICDPLAIMNYSAENYHYFTQDKQHNSSMCYLAKLDFVNLLSSDENQIDHNIWVVQASISDVLGMDSIRRSVFHVNSDNFEVNSDDTIHPDTIRYADSLQNTIFSIFKYTASEPKLLQQNIKWGEVTEYLDYMQNNPHMQVLNDDVQFSATQNKIDYSQNKIIPIDRTLDVFEVGYEIDIVNQDLTHEDTNNVTNSYLISPEFPFPVSSTLYSPAHVMQPFKEHEFELISFVSSNGMINDDVAVKQDKTIEDDDILINRGITSNESVGNVIDPVIDDVLIVEEIANDDVINDDPAIIDDVNEIIEEDVLDDVTEDSNKVDESIVKLDDNYDAKDNNSSASLIGLVLLIVLIGGFVYYKKFRNSNNNLKSLGKNKKLSPIRKIIHFNDKVTIKINSLDENS